MKKKNNYSRNVTFDDNALLAELYGEGNENLRRIENQIDVVIATKGNIVAISGDYEQVKRVQKILEALYERLQGGLDVSAAEVDAAMRMNKHEAEQKETAQGESSEIKIKTLKKVITPRSKTQAQYIKSIYGHQMSFGLGPAGTGKTYLAVAVGVEMMMSGEVDRLILTRPAVEAGENLGFLPGDLREKVDPFLRPIYDALHDMMPAETLVRKFEVGDIEVAPLAYMRGRTLSNAFIILDEAQNTTPVQMKMFLTRMGEHSKVVVNGDPSQVDLPRGAKSGLFDAMEVLQSVSDIAFTKFGHEDVVRHPLVAKIVKAYSARDEENKGTD